MSDALQSAIDNNVGLYQAVLGAQGIDFQVRDGLAYTERKAPTYYSNAVTRSEAWRPDDAFLRLVRRAEEEGWEEWSIKDSFAVLDLTEHGFERLFRAEWLCLDPTTPKPPSEGGPSFEVVRTEQALTTWLRCWDADPDLGETIFRPSLLGRADFHFMAGLVGDDVAAGCILNRTGPVVGLSNCFSLDGPAVDWSDAVRAVFQGSDATPVVGYDRGEPAEALKRIGFASLGALQVWRRKADRTGP